MTIPTVDVEYLLEFLRGILNTPSPVGYAHPAIEYIEKSLQPYPALTLSYTVKGALVAIWQVNRAAAARTLTAHADTLGAMVKEIKANGRLKLTKIGSFAWNTVEGEGCTVFANGGAALRGTILLTQASYHVHGTEVNELKRGDDNMEVRLDARTNNAEQTRALGIEVGDFVVFDPRVEITNGFVRSRHLDDKAGVACLVAAIKSLHEANLHPVKTTTFFFSNYEEMGGHGGAAGFPDEITELVTVDMAAVGEGQKSDEFHSTLCVKDSGGVYHHGLSQRLRRIAQKEGIPFKVDIYPYYGSDGESYWRAGGNAAVALIGPGVDASHGYERTHVEALVATTQWILAYLLDE